MVTIGEPIERFSPGKVYSVMDLVKPKKKKKKIGVYEIFSEGGRMMIESVSKKEYTVNGKKGVWRTISGRHYFFPNDKSGTIPPLKWD
jgi:hypothetical protein